MPTPPAGQKTWVEIHGSHLSHNIQSLKRLLRPGVDFCAILKANAYGHDTDTMARLCALEGVRHFGVDSIDEAFIVQKRVPDADIFILGYTVPERIEEAIANNFIQTVYRIETLQQMADICLKRQLRARINLKIETGTQRQGIVPKQQEDILRFLQKEARWIEFTSASSHFANSEDAEHPEFTQQQSQAFQQFLDRAEAFGHQIRYKHIACSAAAILYPQTQHNLVRFGISLYGLWSDEEVMRKNRATEQAIELRPVMSLHTRIAQIKDVPANTPIGYGCTFVTKQPTRIAILPIGYYDGYNRLFRGKAEVLIRGQRCKVVGVICMNMIMVDISNLPHVSVDDVATLLGQDGMHKITAEDLAAWAQTISYEIVTSVSSHLPRVVT